MPIRVGFIVGKDNDAVEDPKYVGDASFLQDLPIQYRVDPITQEYLKKKDANKKRPVPGIAHADVAIPWYIAKHYPEIEIDIIQPHEISAKRLQSNLCNYVIGYDVINGVFEGPRRWKLVENAFRSAGNMLPSWNVQEFVYWKSRYMQACIDAGVPMAPTIFAIEGNRSPKKLLDEIKARGWKEFVMKQSFSAFSLGFRKLKTKDCEQNPKILDKYFKEYAHIPEFIVQECVPGFVNNWETRCFWFNYKFCYAICNKAAVSTASGEEVIVTGDDIPKEFLEEAKRIGAAALRLMPKVLTKSGHPVDMTLVRTDIGCSDTKLHDKDNTWDPKKKTFFLNEIEYGGTNYFIRHLKFDAIPFWAKRFAEKALEVAKKEGVAVSKKRKATETAAPAAKKAATAARVLKKPAAAK